LENDERFFKEKFILDILSEFTNILQPHSKLSDLNEFEKE
jgi:hypothetical protein